MENVTNNLINLTIATLFTLAALRPGQKRRNSNQVAAEREIVRRIEVALDRSPAAVVRAVEAIYARQTSDEKCSHTTRHTNNRGFSQADANLGTWLVETVIAEGRAKGRNDGELLRGKALTLGRRVASKYTRQLLEVAREKAENAAASTNTYTVPAPSAFGFTPSVAN